MNDRPAVVGTARVKTKEWPDQAGGPQENGNRRAAGTAGERNENSGRGRGAGAGTRKTAGAAAKAGVAASWQIVQCAASCGAGGFSAGQWPSEFPWAQGAQAGPA